MCVCVHVCISVCSYVQVHVHMYREVRDDSGVTSLQVLFTCFETGSLTGLELAD